MRIGVDYYPEQCDRSLWESDADLMQQTGVEVVRLAEFAWCRLEPQDGSFDFGWLDDIIGILTERCIRIVLCTPTNCPPLWFYEKYPEAVQTEKDGHKTRTGIRGHRCINNTDFLRYAERIIDVMTKRYADNESVIAWQIDNELEANFCFCETCIGKYRSWLKDKYSTLEAVNAAYGNVMWSGEYSSWEQIQPPFGSYPDPWLNPSYMLDFNRYASDSVIEHINWQAELIRKRFPQTPVTTNVWFCRNMPNYYDEFRGLDFISYDNYPTTRLTDNAEECYSHAFHLDLMRGIKRSKFWIMEQLSGGLGCWAPMERTPSPGMIKGYSLQSFAHGADTVVHFRWRNAAGGAEMHWHGLIDHSNVPGRRFAEFAELCKEAKALKAVCDTEIYSDVAILYSPEDEYAFKIQPQTNGMYYMEQPMLLHSAFTKHGLNVDIIHQCEELTGYKIVVAPEMYLTNEAAVKHLYEFAENGGTVILTDRSGVKDEFNKCIMQQLPTVYRRLVGAYIEEYDSIGYDNATIRLSDGSVYKCRQWCDVIQPETAETVASYDSEFYKGKAAITRNSYGNGTVYYIGTVCEKSLYNRIVKDILVNAGIPYVDGLPDNVEVTTRTGDGIEARFIFNNTNKEQRSILDGCEVCLAPFEMKTDIKER